jgi:RimJ/RimL family protein N-acetyltransferase
MTKLLGNELLRGEKVYLNRFVREDTVALARWWNDLEFQRLLRRRMVEPSIPEDFEWLFKEIDPHHEEYVFAVRTQQDDTLIGIAAINNIFWQARHSTFWIGIGEQTYHGGGYGSDAVNVLLKYAFMELNFNRVGLDVMSYNARAIHAYEKLGFTHEGRLREVVWRDGEYHDILVMGMLRCEWAAR